MTKEAKRIEEKLDRIAAALEELVRRTPVRTFPYTPNKTTSPTAGYVCARCNAWVPANTTHSCTWIAQSAP